MKLNGLPASAYSARYIATIRPELNWEAMKNKLGELLKKYNKLAKSEKERDPNTTMLPLAVSMEQTAKNILWIFMKKFSLGQVKNSRVRFTYSYLAGSVGKEFKAPAVITVTRHIERLLAMPFKFITNKVRSTLNLPDLNTNCIELEIDPRLIVFKNIELQKAHEEGVELSMTPKVVEKTTSLPPINIHNVPLKGKQKNKIKKVVHSAQKMGDAISQFFKDELGFS